MKRISKRVREEAIFICAVRASNQRINSEAICEMWFADNEVSLDLAFAAWDSATEEDFRTNQEHWAAAECLLRSGWSPS